MNTVANRTFAASAFAKLAKPLALMLALALALAISAINLPTRAYASEAQLDHVTDAAGLLTSSEVAALEAQAQAIESEYDFGVYIVTIYDYTDVSSVSVFDAACDIYEAYSLGVGPDDDGLLLLLSMYDRDYSLITYGDFGNYAFNDDARISLTDYFLDDFGSDLWYDGFADYLSVAELYLENAAAGNPYTADNIIMTDDEIMMAIAIGFGAIIVIPLIIALVVVAVLSAKMKSVATATHAREYAMGGLQLTGRSDDFVRTSRVVQRIPKQNSPTTSHRGGFSGTSGKF